MNEMQLAYEKAFNLGDLQTCIMIAKNKQNFNIDLQKLKEAVLKSENPMYCAHYVRWLKPTNIKPFEQVIVNSKNAHIASVFAMEHKDKCDLKNIEKLILEEGDAYDCADYVCFVETDNHEAFKQKILDEEEPYACYLYCLKFQPYGKDLKPFQDIVIDAGDMNTVFLFASNIYDADVCALAEVAFDYGSSEDKINFACLIGNEYDEFYNTILDDLKEGDGMSRFLMENLEKRITLINRFEDNIIKYGGLDDIKDFILNVPHADCEKLQKEIEKSSRTDLKLDIAMSDDTDLRSLSKSILRDLREKDRIL